MVQKRVRRSYQLLFIRDPSWKTLCLSTSLWQSDSDDDTTSRSLFDVRQVVIALRDAALLALDGGFFRFGFFGGIFLPVESIFGAWSAPSVLSLAFRTRQLSQLQGLPVFGSCSCLIVCSGFGASVSVLSPESK